METTSEHTLFLGLLVVGGSTLFAVLGLYLVRRKLNKPFAGELRVPPDIFQHELVRIQSFATE